MRRFSTILAAVSLSLSLANAAGQDALEDEAAADARVIENLRRAGSDLSKPHPIDHYLYFRSEPDARAAANELERLGYVVQPVEQDRKGDWLVVASKPSVPSFAIVRENSRMLNALAKKYAGMYDGWETDVTK
jgi:regulator of RNase E activity RraB